MTQTTKGGFNQRGKKHLCLFPFFCLVHCCINLKWLVNIQGQNRWNPPLLSGLILSHELFSLPSNSPVNQHGGPTSVFCSLSFGPRLSRCVLFTQSFDALETFLYIVVGAVRLCLLCRRIYCALVRTCSLTRLCAWCFKQKALNLDWSQPHLSSCLSIPFLYNCAEFFYFMRQWARADITPSICNLEKYWRNKNPTLDASTCEHSVMCNHLLSSDWPAQWRPTCSCLPRIVKYIQAGFTNMASYELRL